MKPQRSKDGLIRYTVRVDYRIGRDDICAIVGYMVHSQDKTPEDITKSEVIDELRWRLRCAGEWNLAAWRDHYESDVPLDEFDKVCERVVDKLFPEFGGK